MKYTFKSWRVSLVAVAVMAVGAGTAARAQNFDQSAFDLLPAEVKASKQIKNVVNAPIAPWVAVDADGNMAGPVVDFTAAIAKIVGVKFISAVSTQANTILDIKAKRADLSFGTMGDTASLEKEGTFLVYLLNPRAFMVRKEKASRYTDLSSTCGTSVALQGTSTSQPILKAISKQYCEQSNKPAIVIKDFPSVSATVLAVQSGQADSILLTVPQVADIAKSAPDSYAVVLAKMPNGMPATASGIFFPIDTKLMPAFQKAFDNLIKSGDYMAILKKYGLESAAIDKVIVNMATTEPAKLLASPPLTDLK